MRTKEQIIAETGDAIRETMSISEMEATTKIMLAMMSVGLRASRKTVASLRLAADHIERGLDALETRQ